MEFREAVSKSGNTKVTVQVEFNHADEEFTFSMFAQTKKIVDVKDPRRRSDYLQEPFSKLAEFQFVLPKHVVDRSIGKHHDVLRESIDHFLPLIEEVRECLEKLQTQD